MAIKVLCAMLYVMFFLPVWALRAATGSSRFGRRFHRRASAWDIPVGTRRETRPDPLRPEGAGHGRA